MAALLNIFVETVIHSFQDYLKISSKEQHLFKTFSNIIQVFTVSFYQFNASILNKSINFLKTNIIDPKCLNCTSVWCPAL